MFYLGTGYLNCGRRFFLPFFNQSLQQVLKNIFGKTTNFAAKRHNQHIAQLLPLWQKVQNTPLSTICVFVAYVGHNFHTRVKISAIKCCTTKLKILLGNVTICIQIPPPPPPPPATHTHTKSTTMPAKQMNRKEKTDICTSSISKESKSSKKN